MECANHLFVYVGLMGPAPGVDPDTPPSPDLYSESCIARPPFVPGGRQTGITGDLATQD